MKLHGQTFKEFCDELFEYEYCSECGGDTKDHEPNILLGNWFARCIMTEKQIEQQLKKLEIEN